MSRSFVRPLQRPLITALLLMTLAPAWGQDRERQREAYGLAILALQRDDEARNQLALVSESVTLHDLVKGLNALGLGPRDMISILQAIKAAGALQAEIEVM